MQLDNWSVSRSNYLNITFRTDNNEFSWQIVRWIVQFKLRWKTLLVLLLVLGIWVIVVGILWLLVTQSTSLRFEDLRHHGYNNKHTVKVEERSQIKETTWTMGRDEQLAQRIYGVTQSQISVWENGNELNTLCLFVYVDCVCYVSIRTSWWKKVNSTVKKWSPFTNNTIHLDELTQPYVRWKSISHLKNILELSYETLQANHKKLFQLHKTELFAIV